jgi:hypothetical protein
VLLCRLARVGRVRPTSSADKRFLRSEHRRSWNRRWGPLTPRRGAVAALVALGLLAPLSSRAAPGDAYTATVSPTIVKPSSSAAYTIVLTNEPGSPHSAHDASITIEGFDAQGISATTSAVSPCVAASWNFTWDPAGHRIDASAPDTNSELCPGAALTVTFQGTSPSAEATYTWATGLGPTPFQRDGPEPTVTVDGTPPPAPVIAGGPAKPTNQTNATFVWSDNEPDLTFSCRRDGHDMAPCSSPMTYTHLSDGAHTFSVRGRDEAGNLGPAATYRWTIDTVPPDTAISSGPPSPSGSSSATFVFTSTQRGGSFSCRLDGAAFAPCTSPETYGGLGNGQHAFAVRATDAAGNADPSPASYTWRVEAQGPTDRTPPGAVRKLRRAVSYRRLKLRWQSPRDKDFDHVAVLVGKSPYGRAATTVYRGTATRYTDKRFKNGTYYRYAITSYDHAGNASRRVSVVVPASALLASPRSGAHLSRPPLLDWQAVPRATYFNVQLYFGSTKILSAWPARSRFKLGRSWSYQGHVYRLKKGTYRWYVWPGFGPRANGRYGQLLGQASFVVTR